MVPRLLSPLKLQGGALMGTLMMLTWAEGSVKHHAWPIVPQEVLLAWKYSAGHRASRESRVRRIRPEHTSVSELLRSGRDDSGMSKRKRQAMLTSLQHQERGHRVELGTGCAGERGACLFTAVPQCPEQGTRDRTDRAQRRNRLALQVAQSVNAPHSHSQRPG